MRPRRGRLERPGELFRRPELLTPAAAALFALLVLLLIRASETMLLGETGAIDSLVLRALRDSSDPSLPWGPLWLHSFGRDMTALGSNLALIALTVGTAGYLGLRRRPGTAFLLLLTHAAGVLLAVLLKVGLDRPRPEVVPPQLYVYLPSFPSGHAMLSALVYLTLAGLAIREEPQRGVRVYLLFAALVLTFGVGVSRVYLGVHWPTDVLGGWAFGAALAFVCLLFAHAFGLGRKGRRRGA